MASLERMFVLYPVRRMRREGVSRIGPEGREVMAIERFVGPDEPILWAARPHAAALARPLALAVLAVRAGGDRA